MLPGPRTPERDSAPPCLVRGQTCLLSCSGEAMTTCALSTSGCHPAQDGKMGPVSGVAAVCAAPVFVVPSV